MHTKIEQESLDKEFELSEVQKTNLHSLWMGMEGKNCDSNVPLTVAGINWGGGDSSLTCMMFD